MRTYLAARLDAITDGAKFAGLFLAAVLSMFLMIGCGPSQDKPSPRPAPVAQPYSMTPDGKTLVPLDLSELGDDCWFEVNQDARVEPLCPPDYGYDTPAGVPTPHPIPVTR